MSDKEIQSEIPSLDARIAMRAYLQRAEVRLSTMHRVAGAFLNGAGLLFLFPVFLKDAFVQILDTILQETLSGNTEYIPQLAMLIAILALPVWSFYLLIKDMVRFYFTAYHAGIARENFFQRPSNNFEIQRRMVI